MAMRMRSTETMIVAQPSSAENWYTTSFGVSLPLSLTQYLSMGSQDPSYFHIPSHLTKLKLARMHILPTSERMGKADRLLTEAKQLLEDYEGSIGLEERRTAEGLLAFTGDFQVGLEDKGIFGRHKQAQEYLERAQETHKMIEQLIFGLY